MPACGSDTPIPEEVVVEEIQLAGPVKKSEAEVSGMTWYKDQLIILPQYPDRMKSKNQGKLFRIAKKKILRYLKAKGTMKPIKPKKIDLVAPGLKAKIPGFEGFESIAFWEDRVFLTIESKPGDMMGYLVAGTISEDMDQITLEVPDELTTILTQSSVSNFTDESLIVTKDLVITIYEGNGKKINPKPVAHIFDHHLKLLKTVPFPTVEYRITDATRMDKKGYFWAVNYFYPGTRKKVKPAKDKIALKHGRGATHMRFNSVERLVRFRFMGNKIKLANQPPLQFHLTEDPRNWEGIAKLDDRGFLVITDEHPRTILGFVKKK